jgi:hypothetical protein
VSAARRRANGTSDTGYQFFADALAEKEAQSELDQKEEQQEKGAGLCALCVLCG